MVLNDQWRAGRPRDHAKQWRVRLTVPFPVIDDFVIRMHGGHRTEAIMHRRQVLQAFAGLALCPMCCSTNFGVEASHWSYEGATRPDKWSVMCSIGYAGIPSRHRR